MLGIASLTIIACMAGDHRLPTAQEEPAAADQKQTQFSRAARGTPPALKGWRRRAMATYMTIAAGPITAVPLVGADLNIAAAWIGILCGVLGGAVVGLFFHRDEWLGGYGSWRRRLARLGHISFFG